MRNMKRSTPLVIREIQSKGTNKYHFINTWLTIIKMTDNKC